MTRRRLVTAAAAVVGIGLLFWFLQPAPETFEDLSARQLTQLERAGVAFIQAEILNALKAPATAKFSDEPAVEMSPDGAAGVSCEVRGWVEADNPFGVPLRETYVGTAKYSLAEQRWSVDLVSLGDDVIAASDFLVQWTKLTGEAEEVFRLSGRGPRVSESFTIRRDWWRMRVESQDGEYIQAEVIDSAGEVVYRTEQAPVRLEVVERRGTFRVRVLASKRWEFFVEQPFE